MEPPQKRRKEEINKYYSVKKTSLNAIFCGDELQRKRLIDFISATHKVGFHATHFIQYLLCVDQHFLITSDAITVILHLLNKGPQYKPFVDKTYFLKRNLLPHIEEYCKITQYTYPNLQYFNPSIEYLTTEIVTNLEVNIKEHFIKKILQYINKRVNLREKKVQLNDTDYKCFSKCISKLKNDFLNDNTLEKLTDQEEIIRTRLVPTDLISEVKSLFTSEILDNPVMINDQVKCDPLSFLRAYCNLLNLYKKYSYSLFTAVPLRNRLAQSSIKIDNTTLCRCILQIPESKVKNVGPEKFELWSKIFDLNNEVFQSFSGLNFEGSISTNGTSVSILFKHPKATKFGFQVKGMTKEEQKSERKSLYFENNIKELQSSKNIVCIDPNKRDLLYCRDSNGNMLRYTSVQRRRETGVKKERKEINTLKKKSGIDKIESKIPSAKIMILEKFVEYLQTFSTENHKIREHFYSLPIHNKWKWKKYIKTQKSESKLIKSMKEKFGNDFSVIMGDWDDAGRTMKFQQSSKNRGWETSFERNKISFFLIDEYKTSSKCPDCENPIEKNNLGKRLSPKPWQRVKGKNISIYGLLGCVNPKCIKQAWEKHIERQEKKGNKIEGACKWNMKYFNRDTLSVRNMQKIVQSVLAGEGRPQIFSRQISLAKSAAVQASASV